MVYVVTLVLKGVIGHFVADTTLNYHGNDRYEERANVVVHPELYSKGKSVYVQQKQGVSPVLVYCW